MNLLYKEGLLGYNVIFFVTFTMFVMFYRFLLSVDTKGTVKDSYEIFQRLLEDKDKLMMDTAPSIYITIMWMSLKVTRN